MLPDVTGPHLPDDGMTEIGGMLQRELAMLTGITATEAAMLDTVIAIGLELQAYGRGMAPIIQPGMLSGPMADSVDWPANARTQLSSQDVTPRGARSPVAMAADFTLTEYERSTYDQQRLNPREQPRLGAIPTAPAPKLSLS